MKHEEASIARAITKEMVDHVSYKVIGAAIYVHRSVGGGLMESVYHHCMKEELAYRGISFETELRIPVVFRGRILPVEYRCDFFVDNCLVVELKSVTEMAAHFSAQLLTYMRLLQAPKGLLINFNCANIFHGGQKTFVNEYYSKLL
jgi:GxxExxY protein